MTQHIDLIEVGPRDGLQSQGLVLSTADKIAFVEQAIGYGARRIEVASFVNPLKVPQMADAEELVAGLPDVAHVSYIGLVLNEWGAERALATKIDELGTVAVATDTFATRNQGQTSAGSVEIAKTIIAHAHAAGRTGQVTIGAAFGCPFEGEVPTQRIVAIARTLADANPREVALADTIGVAVPAQVSRLVEQVIAAISPIGVRVHFHNSRGTGIANVWAAIEAGASAVDVSLGGIGGCPFAPNAGGNVATEDVAYMLGRSDIAHGLELGKVIDANKWLSRKLDTELPAMVARAPMFPASAGEKP